MKNKYTEKKDYYKNGKLRYHFNYKNGMLHGEQKSYHDNGNLIYHYYNKNGIIDGIVIEYY